MFSKAYIFFKAELWSIILLYSMNFLFKTILSSISSGFFIELYGLPAFTTIKKIFTIWRRW